MDILITEKHDGEGIFPTFYIGTAVENIQSCAESNHWMSCTINKTSTYVPDIFVENNILTKEYNPTELIVKKDEVVEVLRIVYEWLYVKNSKGACGWIPANKAVSLENS